MTRRSLALARCCCSPRSSPAAARPAATPATTPRRPTRRKANSAKVDVAKAGDVTLTSGTRRSAAARRRRSSELNQQFQAKYPNVKIKRVAKSFEDLNTTLKLAVSGHNAPDVVEANQGRADHGPARQGRAAPAARRLRGGLRLERPLVEDAARPQPLLRRRQGVRLRQPLRRLADGRDRRRLLQQGQGRHRRRRRSPSSSDARQGQGRRRDRRSCSATSTSSAGIHEFETVLRTSSPTSRRSRDFVFAKDGAIVRHAREPARRRRSSRSGPTRATSQDFNGTGYDPAWQQFAKGKGPFLIAGTWITADLAKAMGDKVGFFLMPGREAGATRSRSAARACRGRSPRSPRTPTWRRPTSTSSPTPNAAEGAGRDGQPAGDDGRAPQPTAPVAQDIFAAWKELNDADGADPVPGLHDADVLRRHLRRRAAAAGRQASRRTRSRSGVQEDYDEVRRERADAVTAPRRRRPPGEPRRVGYLYLLPAFVVFGLFVLAPLVHARGCRCSSGTASRRARGPGSTTTARSSRPGAALGVRARAGPASSSTRSLPVLIGLLLAAAMSRARVRGLALFRTVLFLPQVIALVVVARDVADDLRPRRRAAQRVPARGRARRADAGLARLDFTLALPSVGLIGTWVSTGWRWCCSRPACRRSRSRSTTPRGWTAPGRCASSSRSRCRGCAARSRSR